LIKSYLVFDENDRPILTHAKHGLNQSGVIGVDGLQHNIIRGHWETGMSIGAIAGVAARINGLGEPEMKVIRTPVGDTPNGLPAGREPSVGRSRAKRPHRRAAVTSARAKGYRRYV
jgi:hypothetical protein